MTSAVSDRFVFFVISKVYKNKLFRIILVNSVIKRVRNFFFRLFNLFYLPLLYRKVTEQLGKLEADTQIFVMTRTDFGTFLLNLLYIRYWQKKRCKTALVILTSHFVLVKQLAKIICPETSIIFPCEPLSKFASIFFGYSHVHYETFLIVYARLVVDRPNILFLFDQSSAKGWKQCSNYIQFLDQSLTTGTKKFSPEFCHAYKVSRKIRDFRQNLYNDFINLHYATNDTDFSSVHVDKLNGLKSALNISGKYVVLNINTKRYIPGFDDKKRIQHPERYNVIIDALIEKDYTVVVQGRDEQPLLDLRPGLIDYARNKLASVENDILLYSGSTFAIIPKTGPEGFTTVCNVPLLGLNYVELASVLPNIKMRYFPKHVVDKRTGNELSWQEILNSPCFFDVGTITDQQVEYVDLEEKEMLSALEEFLSLIHKPTEEWLNYTENQRNFMKSLHPMHLDLFQVKHVPCECYLSR